MTSPLPHVSRGEILVVDDNPANLTLLSGMLTEGGYEVRPALNGALALRASLASPPDLILLDVNMPGLNGYDVCRELKSAGSTRDIPVIFISALDAIGDKVMAFEAGGVDYVTKPFQVREILARVETQLTLVRQRRRIEEKQRELDERYRQIEDLHGALRAHLAGRVPEPPGEAPRGPEPRAARETLAVLSTEIHGFTRVAEAMTPERLIADLSVYHAGLARIVAEHGGEVERLQGDALLAFFREPARALEAACHMLFSVADFNARRTAAESPPFTTRAGLATGPAVLARHGPGGDRRITLIGDCAQVASRLVSDARPGGVLLDNATFEAAGRPPEARHIVMRVRGKTELIKAHELVAEVALRLHEARAVPR
jgi:adenylate cyclase